MSPSKTGGGGTGAGPNKRRRELQLNIKGKNDICILHEYAQHVLKVKPEFVFKETGQCYISSSKYRLLVLCKMCLKLVT